MSLFCRWNIKPALSIHHQDDHHYGKPHDWSRQLRQDLIWGENICRYWWVMIFKRATSGGSCHLWFVRLVIKNNEGYLISICCCGVLQSKTQLRVFKTFSERLMSSAESVINLRVKFTSKSPLSEDDIRELVLVQVRCPSCVLPLSWTRLSFLKWIICLFVSFTSCS